MMTIDELERALARYGVSYVADGTGAVHFDAPIPLPVNVMNAIIRLTPALARRCRAKPVRNAPPERRQHTPAGGVN